MDDIRQIIKRASRRLGLNEFIVRLHLLGMAITALVLLAVLAGKAVPWMRDSLDWMWVGPGLGMILLAAAGFWTLRRRPGTLHVAIEVDDRLNLREKLSTALACRDREDAFAQAAIDDAIAVARKADTRERLKRHFAVRTPQNWWIAPAVLLTALLAGFIPNGDLFARESHELSIEDRDEIRVVQENLDKSIEEIAKDLKMEPDKLKELLEDKENKEGSGPEAQTPEQVKREAFKKYNAMQDMLREVTEGEQAKALEALKSKLAQLSTTRDGPASELSKALAKGNFKDAKKALDKLQEKIKNGNLTEEQKKALQEQLQELAKQLGQLAQANAALANALQQAGLDGNLASNPQALKEALQNAQNLTEEQKQQLQQMANAMAQAGQICQSMGGAMQGIAGDLGGDPAGLSGQLSSLEMMQADMASLQAGLGELAGQCQGLGQGLGQGQSTGIAQNAALQMWLQQMQGNNSRGPGMGPRGQGAGGRSSVFPTQTRIDKLKAKAGGDADAPIIGTTVIDGQQLIIGEAQREISRSIAQYSSRAQEDANDDRIQLKYQDAVQHFFGDLEARIREASAGEGSTDAGEESGGKDDK